MITIFTLINSFTCFFLKKNKQLCLFYNARRGKMAQSHEKVGGCSHPSCPFT